MMWTSPSCLIIRGMRSSIIMLDFSTPLFQLALFSQVSFMIIHSTATSTTMRCTSNYIWSYLSFGYYSATISKANICIISDITVWQE